MVLELNRCTCQDSKVRLAVRPPVLEELPHVVSGAADGAVVLVEHLAVAEYQPDVGRELLFAFIPDGTNISINNMRI